MRLNEADPARPPRGAWLRRHSEGFELGATTRSGAAFFMVPFMTAFSAFEVFIAFQIHRQIFSLTLLLVSLLFLAFTLFFWLLTLLTVCGKLVVTVKGDEGKIFAGVGPIGSTRKFKWNEIREARVGTHISPRGNHNRCIILQGSKHLSLGSGLKDDRLKFIVSALNEMLRAR